MANTLGIINDYNELDFSIDIKTDDSQKDIIIKSEKDAAWPMIRKRLQKGAVLRKNILILGNCYAHGILWPISAELFENTSFYRVNYKEDWATIKQYFSQDITSPNEKIIVIVGHGTTYGFLKYFLN